jgi:hypothetical protein
MISNVEIWKDVIGYKGYYRVSNFGRVKSIHKKWKKKEKFLSQCYDKKKYPMVHLSKNKKSKIIRVHKIVAKAFIGISKLQINHIDGNKLNNNVNNLEYVTCKENIKHAFKNNLRKYTILPRPIICNNTKIIYSSIAEASRDLNVSAGAICRVLKGQRKSTRNKTFSYL